MIKAQVSLYPVDHEEVTGLHGLSTQFLDEHALDYDFRPDQTSLNTTIAGGADDVWTALRHLFQENLAHGHDVVMITTLTHWDARSEKK